MTEAIQIYKHDHEQFGSIRALMLDGEPWFFAIDVAKALGYERPSDAVYSICKKSKNLNDIGIGKTPIPISLIKNEDGTPLDSSIGSLPKVMPESDLYRLIMRSNMPKAIEFQDWVCEEVLPAIRKKGFYIEPTRVDLRALQDAIGELVARQEEQQKELSKQKRTHLKQKKEMSKQTKELKRQTEVYKQGTKDLANLMSFITRSGK